LVVYPSKFYLEKREKSISPIVKKGLLKTGLRIK